jgi:hypothetical protein
MPESNQAPMNVKAKPLTWAQMVAIEPRLAALLAEIRKIKDDKRKPAFCANMRWYDGTYDRSSLKGRLLYLAGFHAAKEELRTMEAYDLAYDKLYSVLPDCRNCQCFL